MVTKSIKGGKTNDTPDVRHITLRGVRYTIREVDADEYDAAVTQVADTNGNVRYDRLLRVLVAKAVSPLGDRPLKYPVFRTLQNIVEDMHFTELEDEAKEEEDEVEGEETAAPNA